MKRFMLMAVLMALAMLVFAPAAFGQQDVDCADVTFAQAQVILAQDASDPNRLDADGDRVACETSGGGAEDGTVMGGQNLVQSGGTPLPVTGGPALLIPAGAGLLLAGGLGVSLLRRR